MVTAFVILFVNLASRRAVRKRSVEGVLDVSPRAHGTWWIKYFLRLIFSSIGGSSRSSSSATSRLLREQARYEAIASCPHPENIFEHLRFLFFYFLWLHLCYLRCLECSFGTGEAIKGSLGTNATQVNQLPNN